MVERFLMVLHSAGSLPIFNVSHADVSGFDKSSIMYHIPRSQNAGVLIAVTVKPLCGVSRELSTFSQHMKSTRLSFLHTTQLRQRVYLQQITLVMNWTSKHIYN